MTPRSGESRCFCEGEYAFLDLPSERSSACPGIVHIRQINGNSLLGCRAYHLRSPRQTSAPRFSKNEICRSIDVSVFKISDLLYPIAVKEGHCEQSDEYYVCNYQRGADGRVFKANFPAKSIIPYRSVGPKRAVQIQADLRRSLIRQPGADIHSATSLRAL